MLDSVKCFNLPKESTLHTEGVIKEKIWDEADLDLR